MRRGQEICQGARASNAWLNARLRLLGVNRLANINSFRPIVSLTNPQAEWLKGKCYKHCVSVQTEREIRALYSAALSAGLEAHLIEDVGLTIPKDEETPTALAIGPDYAAKIDPLTKHLLQY